MKVEPGENGEAIGVEIRKASKNVIRPITALSTASKYKTYHVQRDHQGHVDTRTLTPEHSELLEGLGERDIVAINGTMLGGQT